MKYKLKGGGGSRPTLPDPYSDLNEEQHAAVVADPVPVLILAGAGSGKTRTLVSRAAHLILKGTQPHRLLMVTFTQKAAREMKDRVESMLGPIAHGIWAGTFHHVGHRFVRNYAKLLGFREEFNIMDRHDVEDFLGVLLHELRLGPPITARKAATIFNLMTSTQESLESVVVRRFPTLVGAVPDLERLHLLYRERKVAQGVVDYDDLLVYWRELLESEAGDEIRERFDHVLVDEYQDTNALQGQILDLLVRDHRSITVVGDDAQAIYGFRGASPRNILTFTERYPDAEVYKLQRNYRSTQEILDIANEVISRSPRVLKKKLVAHRGEGIRPVVVAAYDEVQEAMFVRQHLWELHTEEGIPLDQIAILYRAHHQAVQIQVELAKHGIPFQVYGGTRLFEQAHFKDVMAYIRVRRRPQDQLALYRVFRMEPGLGQGTARKVLSFLEERNPDADTHPFLDVNLLRDLAPKQRDRLLDLGHFLMGLPDAPQDQLEKIIRRYEPHARRMYDDPDDRLKDLSQVVQVAGQYSDMDDLLADLGLEYGPSVAYLVEPPEEKPEEMVVLTSIHQAKGLEWQVVFLMGVYDGAIPSQYSLSDLDAVEEERRILHVALTRAKDRLYVTYPMLTEDGYRGRVVNRISRFMDEVPEKLYDTWELEVE